MKMRLNAAFFPFFLVINMVYLLQTNPVFVNNTLLTRMKKVDFMEKTIRELASELNISKEAIYRKINHSMKNELADHIIKKDGKTYISAMGQSIICQSLKREMDEIEAEQTEVNNSVTNRDTAANLDYIRHLEKQLDLLQTRYDDEVNNNRRERETLYQLNQSLIDTFNREQHLQYADKQLQIQEKQTIQPEHSNEPTENETPKGFFEKLFKRK